MYFYPFVFFLVAGVNGSFMTGDLFNLFVCFEVMLVASFVLISLGATKQQLKRIDQVCGNQCYFLLVFSHCYWVFIRYALVH